MAVRRMHPRLIKAYQADMQLAGRLLDDLRLGHLALAFQPVTLLEPAGMAGGGSGARAGRTPYHEGLLRPSGFSAYHNYARSEEHTAEIPSQSKIVCPPLL